MANQERGMKIGVIQLGPLENNFIAQIARDNGVDSLPVIQDIVKRSKGNPGSATVLSNVYKNIGEAKYLELAPKIPAGTDIWLRYEDKCGKK